MISLETSANGYDLRPVRENETSTAPDGFERLENDECVSQYARQLVPNRSDLYIVIDSDYDDTSYAEEVWPETFTQPNVWMCRGIGHNCDPAVLKANPEDWKINWWSYKLRGPTNSTPIKYCLSKPVEENCRLSMSVPLMAIIVACNVLKIIGLGLT